MKFRKVALKLLILAVLIIVVYLSNRIFLSESCKYSDSIKENNYIVNGEYPEEGQIFGCHVGKKSCTGLSCVAPLIPIECGKSREMCGDVIKCECE